MAVKKTTLKPVKKGQKPITFRQGGLHESLGVPKGQKIPAKKMDAAARGEYGPKAQSQANFAKNVLGAGRKTAAANRRAGRSGGKAGKSK